MVKNLESIEKITKALSQEEVNKLANSLEKLSYAKSLPLNKNILSVWGKLIECDINKNNFSFNNLLEAIEVVIRTQVFNRLDYADVYREAVAIKQREIPKGYRLNPYGELELDLRGY